MGPYVAAQLDSRPDVWIDGKIGTVYQFAYVAVPFCPNDPPRNIGKCGKRPWHQKIL